MLHEDSSCLLIIGSLLSQGSKTSDRESRQYTNRRGLVSLVNALRCMTVLCVKRARQAYIRQRYDGDDMCTFCAPRLLPQSRSPAHAQGSLRMHARSCNAHSAVQTSCWQRVNCTHVSTMDSMHVVHHHHWSSAYILAAGSSRQPQQRGAVNVHGPLTLRSLWVSVYTSWDLRAYLALQV